MNTLQWIYTAGEGALPVTYNLYDSGLVLMSNFDKVSAIGDTEISAKDISQSQNNFLIANGTAWLSNGKYGGAYMFDGYNDFIQVSMPIQRRPNSFSAAAWFKTTSTADMKILSNSSAS